MSDEEQLMGTKTQVDICSEILCTAPLEGHGGDRPHGGGKDLPGQAKNETPTTTCQRGGNNRKIFSVCM